MAKIRIRPSSLSGRVRAPPSKSYTHRAVFLSTLADGESRIESPLSAGDTLASVRSCGLLGARISMRRKHWRVNAPDALCTPEDIVYVANSGTTLRIITAVSSLTDDGYSVITGDESIRARPMQPLLNGLGQLGVKCWSTRGNGCAPIVIKGGGIAGGTCVIEGDVSSQFISALLIASLRAERETQLKVTKSLVSRPYVDATFKVIEHFGGAAERANYSKFIVPPSQRLKARDFRVPGDFSSASLIAACALLSRGEVSVDGLNFDLPQADAAITGLLTRMGANVRANRATGTLTVKADEGLRGGVFDLSDCPDLLPVVSVLALIAREDVRIVGVEHARFKESDRLSVLANELAKLGAALKEHRDSLTIRPSRLKPAVLDAHNDHRLFMAFCAAAQAVPGGCTIEGAESTEVSYPSFLEDLRSLGGRFELIRI